MPHSSERFAKWFCYTVGDSLSFAWQQRQMLLAWVCDLLDKFNIPVENNFTTFVSWKIIEAGSVSLTSFQRDNSFLCAKNME